MQSALDQFNANIDRIRALMGLHGSLSGQLTAAVDLSDLLRACHVMSVSAIDHYVHEITRIGIMDIFDGTRAPSAAYGRLRLAMRSIDSNAETFRANTEADIREQHGYLAFQQPDKISDAIRLVSDRKLWEEVASIIGDTDAKSIKTRLSLIVDRRNKIAHEADLDPTYPDTRWPIKYADVESTVDFVVAVTTAIHQVATSST